MVEVDVVGCFEDETAEAAKKMIRKRITKMTMILAMETIAHNVGRISYLGDMSNCRKQILHW